MEKIHSISIKGAKSKFYRLIDENFQWWLRLPIINLLWRHDFIRFIVSIKFLITQLLEATLLINNVYIKSTQALEYDVQDLLKKLTVKPKNLIIRIEKICSLHDFRESENESRKLLLDTILLGCNIFNLEFTWLKKINELHMPKNNILYPNPKPYLSIAEELAILYKTLDSTIAIGVGGSLSKGFADETSDIDLDIISSYIPEENSRYDLMKDKACEIRLRSDHNSANDEYFIGKTLIDVRYWNFTKWSKLVEKPQISSYWDEEALSHLDSMKILWDPNEVIVRHKTRLKITTANIRKRRVSNSLEQLSVNIQNLMKQKKQSASNREILFAITDCISSIFNILAALNNEWVVFPKWSRQWIESLKVCIPGLYPQIECIILEKLPKNDYKNIILIIKSLFKDLKKLGDKIKG